MEDRINGDGQLYPNKYKDAPNKPDTTGEVSINKETLKQLVTLLKEGKEPALKVAIWNRQSKAGNTYYYFRYEPVEARAKQDNDYQKKAAPAPAPKAEQDFNDDIPF